MKYLKRLLLVIMAPLCVFATDEDPLLIQPKVQPFDWSPGQSGELIIEMSLPNGYHAYSDKFKINVLEPDGFISGKPQISPVVEFFDKTTNKKKSGIAGKATLRLTLEAPDKFIKNVDKFVAELEYQACTDTFCLFPVTKQISVPIRLGHVTEQLMAPEKSTNSFFDTQFITQKLSENRALSFLLVFIAGILTCFTPCIFPMIPITLAILGHESEKRSRLQNFYLSLSYVHGIATTYSLLGVIVASTGAVFGASLQNKYVVAGICLMFFAMALSMYGFFELQVPHFVRHRLGGTKKTTGLVGAYLSGLIAGVIASPCVGPVLVSILTYVATTGNRVYGFFLLFTYAMGLGLIFLVLGAFTELTRLLPKNGPWMESMKMILGSLMMGAVYYYLNLLVDPRIHDILLGIGLVSLSSYFGAMTTGHANSPFKRVKKGLLQGVLIIGFGFLVLGVFDLRPNLVGTSGASKIESKMNWQKYSDETLQKALTSGKPVIIDFRADWCGACLELEDYVFTNERVEALSQNFELLKFDATKDSVEFKTLQERYRIKGLPHVVFYSAAGKQLVEFTLNQYESPDKFQHRMEKVMNKTLTPKN